MFKKDFIWGTATSSYQIEGAAYEDGKGLNMWDTFCKEPGRIFENHTGDQACDHYHLYKEDFKLMAELGIKHYRFSFSWARLIPDGIGAVNPKGIQFYSDLIDEMLKNGITPYATLFHWDYPYELYKRGGWMNPDSPKWFAEYTKVIAENFGDRIKMFFTINEPQIFIGKGYVEAEMTPGMKYSLRDTLQMAHNVLLSHGHSVQILRSIVPDCKVGFAPTGNFYHPETNSPEDIEAAKIATFDITPENWHMSVAWWSDPIMLGKYPEKAVQEFGENMPKIGPKDMELICQPLDFYGTNLYLSFQVKADDQKGYVIVEHEVGHSKTGIGWPVTPDGLYYATKFVYERYQTPIFISENGFSAHDCISLDGKVHDPNRIDFLNRYLLALGKSVQEGADIAAYFHWSFMDNFEWASGYGERFGLVYVDYKTMQRIPKDSAYWYKDMLEQNGQSL